MYKKYCFLIVLLAYSWTAYAQVRFYATTDAKEVLKDSYIRYTIILENANGSNLKTPDFEGFTLVNGPARSSNMSTINGKTSSSVRYTYTLLPPKVGTYQIKPATMQVNGRTMRTEALTIKVIKSQKQGTEPKAFLKMTISDSTAVVGQRLVLTYTLYYDIRLDIRREELRSEDPFRNFTAERINNYRRQAISRQVIDGNEYYVKTLAETAIIPKDTGDFRIKGAQLLLQVPSNTTVYGRFQSLRGISANAEDIAINVIPLPYAKPLNNSGVIGSYSISSTVNKTNITEDDAINLSLKITGTGIAKDLIAPSYPSTDYLDIYDPSLVSENAFIRDGSLYHETIYEYLIVPKGTGRAVFVPEFTFYDTDSMQYRTIRANKHNISIRKSNDITKADDSQAIQQQADSLQPLTSELKISKKKDAFYLSSAYWIILFLLALGAIIMAIAKWILIRKENEDPELKKARKAQKLALDKLKLAKKHLDNQEIKPFYKEISNAMLGYVSDKLQLNTADITKTNVRSKLQEISVSIDECERFIQVLNHSEMALYAGSQDVESMQQSYDDATQLLIDIESYLADKA